MAGGEGQALSGDLQAVAMAASLENSGIATYMAGIKAATAGKLGTGPARGGDLRRDRDGPA